ncbi:HNH endonuclease [Desulfurobacterium sp.]
MEWFDRVRREVFSGKVSDSDIQNRKAFDCLWNVYDYSHQLLFLEFGREFAGKITLWRDYLEFSYGWRSLEVGRRTSVSQLPRYALMVFSDGTFSISLNNIYNKTATRQFVSSIRKALENPLFRKQMEDFIEKFKEAFIKIEDTKGERVFQLSEFSSVEAFLRELTGIKPSKKYALKGGYVNFWFSMVNDEIDIYDFLNREALEFICLTKPLYIAFYLPLTEVEPKRRIRSASERHNWERIKKELLQLEGRCQLCGVKKPLEVAHIVPYSQRGADSPENLFVLCRNCHGKMVPTEPIGVRKIKGKYWLSYVEKDSRSIRKEPLQFSNHTLKENDFWRYDE